MNIRITTTDHPIDGSLVVRLLLAEVLRPRLLCSTAPISGSVPTTRPVDSDAGTTNPRPTDDDA